MRRVCLDSNVLVAAFASRGLCADLLKLVLTEYHLVVPEVVAEEVRRVLTKKFKLTPAALSAVSQILISGDAALLTVAAQSPIPILSPRAFMTLTRGGAL